MKDWLKVIVGGLLLAAVICFSVSYAVGAEPVAKSRPVAAQVQEEPRADMTPTPEQQEAFRRLRKPDDEGLEKILDKKFVVPTPNVFTGIKILMWGLTIAGVILGVFFAGVIVVFTLRILRKYIAPTVTGIPDATPAILQVFDNVRQKIENKSKELAAEKAEIDKRIVSMKKKESDE